MIAVIFEKIEGNNTECRYKIVGVGFKPNDAPYIVAVLRSTQGIVANGYPKMENGKFSIYPMDRGFPIGDEMITKSGLVAGEPSLYDGIDQISCP
jgi:hypothetical protein